MSGLVRTATANCVADLVEELRRLDATPLAPVIHLCEAERFARQAKTKVDDRRCAAAARLAAAHLIRFAELVCGPVRAGSDAIDGDEA